MNCITSKLFPIFSHPLKGSGHPRSSCSPTVWAPLSYSLIRKIEQAIGFMYELHMLHELSILKCIFFYDYYSTRILKFRNIFDLSSIYVNILVCKPYKCDNCSPSSSICRTLTSFQGHELLWKWLIALATCLISNFNIVTSPNSPCFNIGTSLNHCAYFLYQIKSNLTMQ